LQSQPALRLLKSKQQSAEITYSIRVGAGGSGNIRDNGPPFNNMDTVYNIRLHDKICVSISKLGFEASEETVFFFTP